MKKLSRALSIALVVWGFGWAAVVWAHSPMYDPYKFDDSNGGESGSAELRSRIQRFGPTSLAAGCVGGSASGFPCNKIDLQAFVPKANMGATGSTNLNDIWGWTDPTTGAEIAIVGLTNGTSFVDISNPASPVYLGRLDSHDGGTGSWRDIKVYNDHAFIVADGSGNSTHGLQVYDLRQLRNISNPPVNLSETAHLGTFGRAHNIAINEDTGYAYVVGSNQCSGGLHMVDISSPQSPSFAGCFSADGYVHDTQCVVYAGPDTRYRGNEICVGYNEDTITIIDVSNKNNPVQISRTPYTGSRYTHQGWFLDDNHTILIMNDELDEQRRGINTTSYIFDVSDLQNPVEIGRYVGPTAAVDHNLYVRDGLVFEANYRAGLRILTTSNIAQGQLQEAAFFDVIPNSNSAQFSGSWSSYIYFASGNIIVSDIGGGLFVLLPDYAAIGNPPPPPPPPPPTGNCFYTGGFELTDDGWASGTNSCSTGAFVRGTPNQQSTGGLVTQVGGAAAGTQAWFTAANTALGTDDVDGGTCETLSPVVDASSANAAEVRLSYFHGQRDAGDDGADGFTVEVLNNGSVVDTLVDIGDVTSSASWTSVSTIVSNPGSIRLRVRATDGTANGDIVEAGIDDVSICPTSAPPPPPPPPPPSCTVQQGFESGAGGWTNDGASTCTTGAFVVANPSAQATSGVTTQPGGAASGTGAYFTATNSSVGNQDVDGGNCIARSPSFSVAQASELSIDYFHGQRDAGDDSAGDFFRLEVSTDGGASFQTIASAGDVTSDAAWQTATTAIPAGANVVVRVQCSDGAGPGDIVECGVDNFSICTP